MVPKKVDFVVGGGMLGILHIQMDRIMVKFVSKNSRVKARSNR